MNIYNLQTINILNLSRYFSSNFSIYSIKYVSTVITSQLQFNLLNIIYGKKRFITSLGNYDQCMANDYSNGNKIERIWIPISFKNNEYDSSNRKFDEPSYLINQTLGKRESIKLNSNLNIYEGLSKLLKGKTQMEIIKYLFGLCVPNTCDSVELSNIINKGDLRQNLFSNIELFRFQ